MTGEHDYDSAAQNVHSAYHVPPINAHRALILGLDGSNAVAVKVASDGTVATSGGAGASIAEAVIPAGFDVAGTAASSTYATALSSATWRWLKIVNTTDQDFAISFDAGVTQHKRIASGLTEFIDLYSNALKITAAVSYKYLTLPTRGRFQVEGLSA